MGARVGGMWDGVFGCGTTCGGVHAHPGARARLQAGFDESQAAVAKRTAITIEKTSGKMKRYCQLTNAITGEGRARAQPVTRMAVGAGARRAPSCQARIAAKK